MARRQVADRVESAAGERAEDQAEGTPDARAERSAPRRAQDQAKDQDKDQEKDQARDQAKDACKADAARFCKGVERGKVGDCLQQHQDELFIDCRVSRKKMNRMRAKESAKTQEAKPVQK